MTSSISPARVPGLVRRSLLATAALACLVLSVACSSEPEGSGGAATLAGKYEQLGDRLGKALALAKSSATEATTAAPAELAEVASVPKGVTGGLDVTAEQTGKLGHKTVDVDAVAGDEQLTVFVPDVATGTTRTSVSAPSFAAWRGSAASKDEGLCYLAWSKAASWFVVSPCGDTSGAWVCSVTSDGAECDACSADGGCESCDMELTRFDCGW